jgi:hypothetical protein
VGAGNALETEACPVPICPWVRQEEGFVSCAKAAEVSWPDMGASKKVARNIDTAQSNVVSCLFRRFSRCVDGLKGRMVGLLHVARSAIRRSGVILLRDFDIRYIGVYCCPVQIVSVPGNRSIWQP